MSRKSYGYLMREMDRLSNEYGASFDPMYEFAKALKYLTIRLSDECKKEFTGVKLEEAGKLFKWMNTFLKKGDYISDVDLFIQLHYSNITYPSIVEDYLDEQGFGDDYSRFDKNLSDYDYDEIVDTWLLDIMYELFPNTQSPSIYKTELLIALCDRYDIDEYISKLERSL